MVTIVPGAKMTILPLVTSSQAVADSATVFFIFTRVCSLARVILLHESTLLAEYRYSPIQGVSVWGRHRLDQSRIGRIGGKLILGDSEGVRAAVTWVGSGQGRQTKARINIRRFRGLRINSVGGQSA